MSSLVWHQVNLYYITDESLLFTISKYKFAPIYTAWAASKKKVEMGEGGKVISVDNGSLGNFEDLDLAKTACEEYAQPMQNKKPSAAVEKAWLERLANYGCVVTKESCIQIHHPLGREAKQDKYHIGRFFANPLTIRLHDVGSNDPLNVTHHRKAFVEYYDLESVLFQYMCYELEEDGPLPFTEEEMAAIMATKR